MAFKLKKGVTRLFAFLEKPSIKGAFSFILAVSIFAVILLNRTPNYFHFISLNARAGFNSVVILLFLLLYVTFRLPGWIGNFLSLALTLALFAFALAGLWAIGLSQSALLNGIVPLTDAAGYYTDALRLSGGQDFSLFSARRPLFAGLLSVILWATNYNLMSALSIFTLITALACYVAAKEIQRTSGSEVAVFALIILFLFYRHHSGTVMSENLGVPLGTLGFALLWRGTADRNPIIMWMGLFVTTFALNARAGAFLVLPLLILWGGLVFKDPGRTFSWRFFVIGSLAVTAGFAVNLSMVRLLATPSGVPFSNFSYTLYGLASGGNTWGYVTQMNPELLQLPEPVRSMTVYQMAFDLIKQRPFLLVKGALFNWSMLFSDSWYSAYSFVGGENQIVQDVAQWGIYFLCILGFARWILKRNDPLAGLVGVAAVGVLLSVPFVPPTDAYRMRPYAASMIIFGLLPAMGLLLGMETLKIRSIDLPNAKDQNQNAMLYFTALLVGATIIGPLIIKSAGSLPPFEPAVCEPGLEPVWLRFDPGTHFNIVRRDEPGPDWMPNFHIGRFRNNAHGLTHSALIRWARRIEPSTSLFGSLDYRSMQHVLIVTPTELLPEPGTLWQACGKWEAEPVLDDIHVFEVQTPATVP